MANRLLGTLQPTITAATLYQTPFQGLFIMTWHQIISIRHTTHILSLKQQQHIVSVYPFTRHSKTASIIHIYVGPTAAESLQNPLKYGTLLIPGTRPKNAPINIASVVEIRAQSDINSIYRLKPNLISRSKLFQNIIIAKNIVIQIELHTKCVVIIRHNSYF